MALLRFWNSLSEWRIVETDTEVIMSMSVQRKQTKKVTFLKLSS